MNIEHISVSRMQTWKECGIKYRFRYHYKTPSPEPEKPYFLYGKVIHKIAEEYVNYDANKSIKEIAKEVLGGKILLEEKVKDDPVVPIKTLPNSYLKKVNKHLNALVGLTKRIGTDGICEHKFKYDLDPPAKKHAYGFIDRLIQKGDHYFIVDYKTTKKGPWRRTERDVVHDLQLQCYARAIQKEFNVPAENIRAGLFYLEGQELIGAKFSNSTLQTVEAKLLEAYNDIQMTDPENATGWVGERCRRCEYRTLCPLYSLT